MHEKSLPVRADNSDEHAFRKDYMVTFLKSKSVIQKIRDFFSFYFSTSLEIKQGSFFIHSFIHLLSQQICVQQICMTVPGTVLDCQKECGEQDQNVSCVHQAHSLV